MKVKVIICSDEAKFRSLDRMNIAESYFVAYRNENGFLEVIKNRFNGVTGVMTDQQFKNFVELADKLYEGVDN